jgi:SAM-dependent methyltransferase
VSSDFQGLESSFDTALCVNVLEYLDNPAATIADLARTLVPGGSLVVLVPQNPSLFATVDLTLGQRRRFRLEQLCELLEKAGLSIERVQQLNKIGAPAWWVYGRFLRRKYIGKATLKLFDKTVWFWRRVDGLLPWRGLSLIVAARKAG